MKIIRGRKRGMDVGKEASDLDLGAAPGRGTDDSWAGLRDMGFCTCHSFNRHLSRAYSTPGPVLSAGSLQGPSSGELPFRGCEQNVNSQARALCLWSDGG